MPNLRDQFEVSLCGSMSPKFSKATLQERLSELSSMNPIYGSNDSNMNLEAKGFKYTCFVTCVQRWLQDLKIQV